MSPVKVPKDSFVCSTNYLKRIPDHETLDADMKRMALDDNKTENSTIEQTLDSCSRETTDYINIRMLCVAKEASKVVGGKGDRVNRIKLETNTRINVSENLAGVLERVIFVRGSCEDVAKAFGKIVRAINNESENVSNEKSLPLVVNLLIPHHYMGCIIGRNGSKLREIEELSAARLFAAQQQLPMSNDRVLSLTGVADAIHIATYYIGQTILENEQRLRLRKSVFYHPGPLTSVLLNTYTMGILYQNAPLVANGLVPVFSHQEHHPLRSTNENNDITISKPSIENSPQQMLTVQSSPTVSDFTSFKNIRILSQPETHHPNLPHLVLYTEIYIDENFVGNIIGKGGKTIQKIKYTTGCVIKIDDPVVGLTERRLVLIGSSLATNIAIRMIDYKIDIDRRKRQLINE